MSDETTKETLYNAWKTACDNVEIATQKRLEAMRTKDRKVIFEACDVLTSAMFAQTKAALAYDTFEEWEIRRKYNYKNVPESPYYNSSQDEDGNNLDAIAFEKWWRDDPDDRNDTDDCVVHF